MWLSQQRSMPTSPAKPRNDFEPRPELEYSSHALEQRARDEARQNRWLVRLDSFSPDTRPRVFIGA